MDPDRVIPSLEAPARRIRDAATAPPHVARVRGDGATLAAAGTIAIGVGFGLAPAGELADHATAVAQGASVALLASLAVFRLGWALRAPSIAAIACVLLGPLVGLATLGCYRWLRYGRAFEEVLIDVAFGLAAGLAIAGPVYAARRAREGATWDAAETARTRIAAWLAALALVGVGCGRSGPARAAWSWQVAAVLLFATAAALAATVALGALRRANWLARVYDGREPAWSVARDAMPADALPPIHADDARVPSAVLLYAEPVASGPFRDGASGEQVARVASEGATELGHARRRCVRALALAAFGFAGAATVTAALLVGPTQ